MGVASVRTTGQLQYRFQVLSKRAKAWLSDLPRSHRPAIHLFPYTFHLGRTPSRGDFAIFPGSFDPPSAAHVRIARAALARGPFRSLIIDLDLENVDKPRHTLSIARRIALLSVAFRKDPRVAIGVSTHGRFLDKMEAARRSVRSRRGVWFVVGADTMDRILQPHYYRRPDREIPRLLRSARFAVFPRGGRPRRGQGGGGPRPRIVPVPLTRSLQAISSTRLRHSLGGGRLPIGEAPDEVLFCIKEAGLYLRSGRPRTSVVTAFLSKGGRVLVLKRSAMVGSFRGAWAGVSGFLEWPLGKLRQLLEDRIGPAEMRSQTLRQACREIREETGLGRASVTLVRRSGALTFLEGSGRRDWVVYPFLFRVKAASRIRLDFEHDEGRWIWPEEMADLKTVPGLRTTLRSVLRPPRRRRKAAPFRDRAVAIARDPKGGAMEILSDALGLIRDLVEFGPVGDEAFAREVRRVRAGLLSGHTMAPLQNLADDIRRAVGKGAPGLRRRLLRRVKGMERAVEAGDGEMVRLASAALRGRRRIGTYSCSSTVAAVLSRVGRRKGVEVTVVGDREGHGRRMRRRLREAGVSVRPIARRLPDDSDALVLGADAVYGKRSYLNARGTGRVVDRARRFGIPIWVLAHRLKMRPRPPRRLRDPSLELVNGDSHFFISR